MHVIDGLGGAFDAFGKGFYEGFLRSASGDELGDYYQQLQNIHQTAMDIGKAFGNIPGVQAFFDSLSTGLTKFVMHVYI